MSNRISSGAVRAGCEQLNLIIKSHPGITIEQLQRSPVVRRLAVQRVGLVGYTCLYEAGTGVMRIHPNPELNDRDMRFLAEKLPSWWSAFELSLSGVETSCFYDWLEEDGQISQKYMTMTPLGIPVEGKVLMIAATSYIDEFLSPVHFTVNRAAAIAKEYRGYVSDQSLFLGAAMATILAATLFSVLWFSRRAVTRVALPIRQLAEAAVGFGNDLKAPDEPSQFLDRSDEIGDLARAFTRMRLTIADQFKRIKNGFDQLWEAQKALSESEAHYRSLFENVPIGIYRMQPDGTPIDVNPALVKMLGYPDKEALFSRPRVEFYVNLQDREAHLAMADSGRHIEPWELQDALPRRKRDLG